MLYSSRNAGNEGGVYRGSIVGLKPGTEYEIQLALSPSGSTSTITANTWNERFPEGAATAINDQTSTLNISTSGTASAYRVYTPAGSSATIDVKGNSDYCVNISASYIIIRGLTLRNAKTHGISLNGTIHDIVIEDCDISGWGRIESDGWGYMYDAAIFSSSTTLTRLIVQRNRIHHPRSDANSWSEARPVYGGDTHPQGPQAVTLFDCAGNNVFRYNECYSDATHMFNDIIGGGENNSWKGFGNRDTDIYGNYLSNNWDDQIESDGGNRNVRIWGNFMENGFSAISIAPCAIGPMYLWRNIVRKISNGCFKLGSGGDQSYMGGYIYIFNTTVFEPNNLGPSSGVWNTPQKNVYTRNNIFKVRSNSNSSIARDNSAVAVDFNYDLYNGSVHGDWLCINDKKGAFSL
jgi:hypothetical protein